jgi:hypothetical protein
MARCLGGDATGGHRVRDLFEKGRHAEERAQACREATTRDIEEVQP